MNEKLLKTRLASIAHYQNEIKKLEEAKAATRATKEELIKSMIEFFPFSVDDVVADDDQIFKINGVVGACEFSERVCIQVSVLYQNRYGQWHDGGSRNYYLDESNWNEFRIRSGNE